MPTARLRPRFRAPMLLVRGEDSPIEIEVWGDSGVQEPASGTVSIVDSAGSAVVTGLALSIDSVTKRAYATVDASSLPDTLSLSDRWRATWSLSIGGETHTFKQDAQLILSAWSPCVTQQDLLDASPSLKSAFNADNQEDMKALADYIQAAVELAQGKLVSNGKRAWLVFDPWRLNQYVVQVALGRIFRSNLFDIEPASAQSIEKLAEHHEDAAKLAWAEMGFVYDYGQTGIPEDAKPTQGPAPIRLGITRSAGVWR